MTESQSRDAVTRRLGEMIDLERRFLDFLDGQQELRGPVQAAAAVRQLRELAAAQRDALKARLDAIDGGIGLDSATRGHRPADDGLHPRPASSVLQASISVLAEAVAGYSALYTTARLMFDGATCDLAQRHLNAYAQTLQAANWLIPDVVAWELRETDLTCRCICPACSLGACLCVRTSVDVLRAGWGASPPFGLPIPRADRVDTLLDGWHVAGLPDGRGVVLRATPRPGSQLAASGMREGDRILSVDDQGVSTSLDLQKAIRRHKIGEEVTLRIERRDGETSEVHVRHVSDL